MPKQKFKLLKKMKSKKPIFRNLIIGLLIIFCAILPYLHDLPLLNGKEGFSGFSSLRIGIWAVSIYILALIPWILFFIVSKGKSYRFTILVPIFMLIYQLIVYIFDARQNAINEFNVKFIVTFSLAIAITIIYFFTKSKRS